MNRFPGLFAASIAATLISVTAYAEEPEVYQSMAIECRELAQSGSVSVVTARRCILACGRLDAASTEAAVQQCKNAYADVTQSNITSTTEETPTHSRSPGAAATPQVSEMADIEGVYLQAGRSGFRVRAEGRKDWLTYCNEAARLIKDDGKFARTVKAYDRVRFTGISYHPGQANDRITHCTANSAVILGPGGP